MNDEESQALGRQLHHKMVCFSIFHSQAHFWAVCAHFTALPAKRMCLKTPVIWLILPTILRVFFIVLQNGVLLPILTYLTFAWILELLKYLKVSKFSYGFFIYLSYFSFLNSSAFDKFGLEYNLSITFCLFLNCIYSAWMNLIELDQYIFQRNFQLSKLNFHSEYIFWIYACVI